MARLSEIIREQGEMPPLPGPVETMASGPFRSTGTTVITGASGSSSQSERDWYCVAEEELSRLGGSVRGDEPIRLEALARTATGIAESLQYNDRLITRALAG